MNSTKPKKCKNNIESSNNIAKKLKSHTNCADNVILKTNIMLLSWIKTMLVIKRFLPNIICLVDKHILSIAESSSYGSFIFGDMVNGTYNQVEKILQMEERKNSLVNINLLIDELCSCLDDKYKRFVYLKYFQNKNFPSVAVELKIDERTAYRWNKIVLVKLLKYCKMNNYTVEFFNIQLSDEKWLLPHFEKCYKSIVTLFAD